MPNILKRVVKVPVVIADENKELRLLKYKALNKIMQESRFLGNMAIRYAIAFRLQDIPKEIDEEKGRPVPLDTKIYRILAKSRKYLDAGTVATLGRNYAVKLLKNNDKDAWAGRKSLPTFRSPFVPIRHQNIKLQEIQRNDQIQFSIEPGFGKNWLSDGIISELNPSISISDDQRKLILVSCFSWKDKGSVEIVKRIVSNEYKLSDSQIKSDGKNITVFLTFSFKSDMPVLDPQRVCGLDLGVIYPAVCALNTGADRMYIGHGEDVRAARARFRSERRRNQKRLGLYTKTRQWKRSEKEDHWIQTYYHHLTRQVIKFCIQHGCGKIHMENLDELRQSELDSEYKRLIWVPSKFYNLLSYKAKDSGIELIRMNPRNTSRRCSDCGHISKGNRKSQSEFVCEICGEEKNADYNAARNIALASGEVIKHGYINDNDEASD